MSDAPVYTSSHSLKQEREHMRLNYMLNHNISSCVLQVPESLRDTKPKAYVPQRVGLGPYHHFRRQVERMEWKKGAAILSILKENKISKLAAKFDASFERMESEEGAAVISVLKEKDISDLVANFGESFEPKTRSCYDGYLDFDKKTLAWVVIVDALFLLDFMFTYLCKSKEEKPKIYSNSEALVRDIMMLENQIPIFLLGELFKQSYKDASVRVLEINIHEFCEKQSPLPFATDARTTKDAFDQDNHMLHYMYKLIVENQSQTDDDDSLSETDDDKDSQRQTDNLDDNDGDGGSLVPNSTNRVRELAKEIVLLAGEIVGQAIEEFITALADAKLAGLEVSGNVEKVSNILRTLQKTLHLDHMKGSFGDQIDIPSASRLNAILKLKFKPLPDNRGIGDIKLDYMNNTLHLPVITLNSNSEVILRNLLAYESTSQMRPTKLRDYMDLICGIIKSEKDVALLKRKAIIRGELPDAEIVRMCNGIKKSDEKPDQNSKVHKIVKDVKAGFNEVGIVKACRLTMKCFAALVKYIFPILVLLLLALQLFCGIYDCRRSSYGGAALRNSYLGELEFDPKAKLMLPRKVYRY